MWQIRSKVISFEYFPDSEIKILKNNETGSGNLKNVPLLECYMNLEQ